MRKLGLVAVAAAVVIWLLRRGSGSDAPPPAPTPAPAAPSAPRPAPAPAEEAIEGYCVKERKKVAIKDPERTLSKNGREAVRGTCPDCGSKIFRFV